MKWFTDNGTLCVVPGTHRLPIGDSRVAAHYRRMFRYIVMDEAQDTSTAQFGVLRHSFHDELWWKVANEVFGTAPTDEERMLYRKGQEALTAI